MEKWEYLTVDAQGAKGFWKPYYVGNQQLQNWQNGPTVFDYMNQLGEQGWELVTAHYAPSQETFIFKRHKQ